MSGNKRQFLILVELELEDEGDALRRLGLALKYLWRSWRCRALRVEETITTDVR